MNQPIALPDALANRLVMYVRVQNRVTSVEECGGTSPDRRLAYGQANANLAPIVERVRGWLVSHPTSDGTVPNGERTVIRSVPVWDGVAQFVTVTTDGPVIDLGTD